jgi:ribosomal protein L12E/L44/L45/RPP1/RPP2
MKTTFSVKNFERFQHYKDRSPPWIKLYNELLDDYSFGLLPDASKLHLVAIWLLASRSNNRIPHDPAWIAKRISATERVDLDLLRTCGFIELHGVRKTPAARKPDADPEREAESETDREKEKEDSSAEADAGAPVVKGRKTYTPAFEAFWRDYPTDALMSKSKAFEKWQRLGLPDRAAAHAALPAFRAHCAKDLTYRPVHAERFLSQRRFDGFVEAAKVAGPMPENNDALRALWSGRAGALIDAIGAAKFQAWFADTQWEEGPPAVLRVAKPFAAKWIGEHYTGDLMRLYGEIKIEVKA